MDTAFINLPDENAQYVLTSDLHDITALTDKSKITVSLSCKAETDSDPVMFFSNTLYAFDNTVEFNNVSGVIEHYFRQKGLTAAEVTFTFDGVSRTLPMLYCEEVLPSGFDADNSFLLASMTQTVHLGSKLTIAVAPGVAESDFVIKAVGHDITGSLTRCEKSLQKTLINRSASFAVDEIVALFVNNAADDAPALADVNFFSIEYANIQKMFYVVNDDAFITFAFRNAFNVEEFVDVPGVMSVKTEVSKNTANCNGRVKHYDRSVERKYELVTTQQHHHDAALFEQFLTSNTIQLLIGERRLNIIITDFTLTPSSDDESLTTIKFTWQFEDARPNRFVSAFDGLMPTDLKIFNDTFSREYE